MKTLNNYEKISENTAVALGTFDGVHLAHMRLLNEMKKSAQGLKTCVCTFSDTPAGHFSRDFKTLLTAEEKLQVMALQNFDYLIMKDFDSKVAHMSAEEFLRYLFEDINAKLVVAGFNYRFGAGAAGNCDMIKVWAERYGGAVVIMEEIKHLGHRISSTRIRNEVKSGHVDVAHALMGRPFVLSGEVVTGKQIGRTINFPTVNILPPKGKILPEAGVYAVYLQLGNKLYPGMCNVGKRPTVDDSGETTVETHVLDFHKNIYGKFVRVHFICKLRDEQKFENLDMLTRRLKLDVQHTKKALQSVQDVVQLPL